jgi:asparagine synthase (glutamine-hydrolysing)
MCGIAGKLNFQQAHPVTLDTIGRMCQVMSHRGPDDQGIFLDDGFGMGMRRLSIIDLSTGKQPIKNEDGSVWTVLNGEIYNFLELRAVLEQKGHQFYTNTDTEVIVHLYEEYDDAFVKHLTGMFGIALWDKRKKKLILARDRLGIKPLHYSLDSNRLLFGSEIRALLQEEIAKEIDLQALHDYLSYNYIPGPRTIFKGIRSLPPGHILVCVKGAATVEDYWDLTYAALNNGKRRSEASYSEELYDLLKKTIEQHLISDVPVGVFLSGGVDSSTLVALMSQLSSQTIRTFSIGFEEESFNELASARVVAQQFATHHNELVVRPNIADLLPELIGHFDQPFADSSAVPFYYVSKLARQHVKVALSGEGGDEVFAGYDTYAAHKIAEVYKRLPKSVTTTIIPAIVKRLPVSHKKVSFDYKAKRFIEGSLLPPADGHYWWKVIFTEQAKAELYAEYREGFEDPCRLYRQAYEHCSAVDPLTRLQHIDMKVYLPDDLLVKADRMSMANSLEARVPFLDHRVVEFAASVPPGLKLRGLTKKYILKRTMLPHLPAKILNGKKRGFNPPMATWLRHELRDVVHEVLGPQRLKEAGFFNPSAVAAVIRDHELKRVDYNRNIWSLLVFMLWHSQYLRCSRPDVTGAAAGG